VTWATWDQRTLWNSSCSDGFSNLAIPPWTAPTQECRRRKSHGAKRWNITPMSRPSAQETSSSASNSKQPSTTPGTKQPPFRTHQSNLIAADSLGSNISEHPQRKRPTPYLIKMRVLCLHGMGTNANILETQTGKSHISTPPPSTWTSSMLTGGQKSSGLSFPSILSMSSLMRSTTIPRRRVAMKSSRGRTMPFTPSRPPTLSLRHMSTSRRSSMRRGLLMP
jgi:hypothetical protein